MSSDSAAAQPIGDEHVLPAILTSTAESKDKEVKRKERTEESGSTLAGDSNEVTIEVQDDDAAVAVERVQSKDPPMSWFKIIRSVVGAIFCLYFFLIGLDLMGTAFKVLGGKDSASLYSSVNNPIAGLMVGVLGTVLVQSSSTSTSIVVAMVGAEQMSVQNGIPIIMGANIGTSVTNTIVSMGQIGNRIDLERAFAGATVHDMFNMLSVITLLPLEVIWGAVQGTGGPIYLLTHAITEALISDEESSEMFESPIKAITEPVVNAIISVDAYVIKALTLNAPTPITATSTNSTACAPLDGLCSTYYCVGSTLESKFEKISSSAFKQLYECTGYILDQGGEPCGTDNCYLDAGRFYEKHVEHGQLVKGGFLEGADDTAGGLIALSISLVILTCGLVGLCKLLQTLFLGKAKTIIRYATGLNDYVAMMIGTILTVIVQSSSVVTSALTPLCGLGVLPLSKMLPMTLGANIGTTGTALLASLVTMQFNAVQIALCHLFFNIFGILIWFPLPFMRKAPLGAAKLLGLYASYYRIVPALYILVAFVLAPGVCLGVSTLFGANVAAGCVVLSIILACVGAFEFWWLVGFPVGSPGAYKVLSKEERRAGAAQLAAANAALSGEKPKAPSEFDTPSN